MEEPQMFAAGFLNFLQNGAFADVRLISPVDGSLLYRVHKLILSYSSGYFRKKFSETNCTDGETKEIEIVIERNSLEEFKSVLDYMYSGAVNTLTTDTAINLYALADIYDIPSLKTLAQTFLTSNITRENSVSILQKALELNSEEVITKCLQVITKNFNMLVQARHDFSFCPVNTVIRLIRRNNLAVASEMVVYKFVCDYITANPNLSPQDIQALFENVRFPFMSFEKLKEVEANPLVPRALLTEALLERLRTHETDDSAKETAAKSDAKKAPVPLQISSGKRDSNSNCSRLLPREAYAVSLEYTKDFDEKGLFYYIGSKGGTEAWTNPAARGRVRVSCSSVEKGNPIQVLDRVPSEFWTADVPSSWFQVTLGHGRTLVPNYYTLRHGGHAKADALRNWTLQGSTDGKTWVVLRRHTNDTSLSLSPFSTASFEIKDCTIAFTHFRVVQFGHNSSSNNFLSLSGIEFYGQLYGNHYDSDATSP